MPIPWNPRESIGLPGHSANGTIPPVASTTRIMPRFARFIWLGLGLLAAWESGRGLWLDADRIAEQDIASMAQHLEAVQAPTVAHRSWMEPSLRHWFPQLADPRNFAAAAPETWSEFWTIGHRSDPSTLDPPQNAALQEEIRHGALIARKWQRELGTNTIAVLGSGDQGIQNLRVSVDQGQCRISKTNPLKVRCPDQSSLSWELTEIDYQSRLCLAYRTFSLSPIQIEFEVPWPSPESSLLGHVGFSDFNARLRSDAAVSVQVFGDNTLWIDQPLSDAQGWAALSHPIPAPPPGKSKLAIRARLLLNANRASSASLQRQVIPCIDLRVLRNSNISAQPQANEQGGS